MRFIKVTARPCNSQGDAPRVQFSTQTTFYLNLDLVGAISDNKIMIKGGKILMIGGEYFTDFQLNDKIDLDNI